MILLVSVLLVCIVVRIPIFVSLALSVLVYLLTSSSLDPLVVMQQFSLTATSTSYMAVPLFLLTGYLAVSGKVGDRIIELSSALTSRLKGRLAQLNVASSVFFAGVSGSSAADVAGLGSTLIPMMKKAGYPVGFAAAITATSSMIGPVIPPSIHMIIVGVTGELSIPRLFLGGIIPGLLMAAFMMVTNVIVIRRIGNPEPVERFSAARLGKATVRGIPALAIPVIIVVGIAFGVFTPNESGAIAAIVAVLACIIYGGYRWRDFVGAAKTAVLTTSNVLLVLGFGGVFIWILAIEGVQRATGEFVSGIGLPGAGVLAICVLIALIIGIPLEASATILFIVPTFLPIAVSAGVDPIHFGVVIVVAAVLGGLTPPVGTNFLIACRIANVSIAEFAKWSVPFYIMFVVFLGVLVAFPQLVTFLPDLILGPA